MPPKSVRDRYRPVVAELARARVGRRRLDARYFASRVSFEDLAARLQVSRTALYRFWETQYDFWVDLVRHLVYVHDLGQQPEDMPWRSPEQPSGTRAPTGPDQVLAERLNLVQPAVLADHRVLIRAASLGYPDLADLGAVRRHVEDWRLRQLAAEVHGHLGALGRAVRAPWTELDLATMLWCISDGLSVANHYLPERCDVRATVDFGGGSATWTMLALATRSLYVGLSTPGTPRAEGSTRPPAADAPPTLDRSPAQQHALAVATDLFVESIWDRPGPDDDPKVLQHVTIARAATRAGVSRRTIYNVWPSRAHMLADLCADLLSQRRSRDMETVAAHRTRGGALRLGAATDCMVGPVSPQADADPRLAFLIEVGHPRFRALHRESCSLLTNDLCDAFELHLEAVGRRPRPGVTVDHIVMLWQLLVAGGRRLRRTGGSSSTAFGAAAEALVDELTVDDAA